MFWKDHSNDPILVITAMGRSGTSLMAKYSTLLGFSTGGRWNQRINAGYEKLSIVRLNEFIRDHGGDPGFDATIEKRIRRIGKRVIKDPRFVSFDHVLRHWTACRKQMKVIHLTRDSECIMQSYKTSFKHTDPRSRKEDIDNYLKRFREEVQQLDVPMVELNYPDYLDQYDEVYKALHDFGELEFEYDKGKALWDHVVDKKLVHHKT